MISKSLTYLLSKDVDFVLGENATNLFLLIEEALINSPILQAPNWDLHLKLMCGTSDFVMGAVLGQHINKKPIVVYYASKTLGQALVKYTTTEKELLASVLFFKNFISMF